MDATGETNSEKRADIRERDVFLFSHPRTASNLLCRLLSDQPGWIQSEYHFFDAYQFIRKSFNWGPITGITNEQRQKFEDLLQRGFVELQQVRAATKAEGKRLFVKNHAYHLWEPSSFSQHIWGGADALPFTPLPYRNTDGLASTITTNPTFLPDEFLTSFLPIFLIRHPALTFESWYGAEIRTGATKVFDKSVAHFTSFRYCRQLYDWFASNDAGFAYRKEGSSNPAYPSTPIIIDADDIIEERSLVKLCDLCNMDASFLRYKWDIERPPEEELKLDHRLSTFMGALWASTSIDKSKTSRGIDMPVKYSQWKDEFGTVVADELYALVEGAMSDYTYLKDRKL
ncbi:hypothetical protein V492_06524 [Pseudogymnoascus sp. VKM F-4246]|nr:hypothetical protein V492_06524 [Pseudogymnoascus sp. VKM F-4246]